MKIRPIVLLLVCILFTAWPSHSSETVKVAAIFAKTGIAAADDTGTLDGLRFGVRQLNDTGGVLGRHIELIEFDNRSTALHSRHAAKQAVKAQATAVIGANWSSHSLAAAPVLQKAGIPMITPYSTNPDITASGNFIFRVCFLDTFQGQVMADFALNDLGAEKAAILVNASARYSVGLARYFRQHFRSMGGEVLIEQKYLGDQDDFLPTLTRIKALNPDVLFVPGHVVDSARIIRQARDLGLHTPILGGDGWSDAMYTHAGSALNNTYFSGHWHEQKNDKISRNFVRRFRKHHKVPRDAGAALAYDAILLLADAIDRAESLDRNKIRQALERTRDFQGVTGTISLNSNGDPVKPAVISKYEMGKSVFVKTIFP